jgi:hypothetical protein
MAVTDSEKLAEVIKGIETSNTSVRNLIARVAEDRGVLPPGFGPGSFDDQGRLDELSKVECPNCGHHFRANN